MEGKLKSLDTLPDNLLQEFEEVIKETAKKLNEVLDKFPKLDHQIFLNAVSHNYSVILAKFLVKNNIDNDKEVDSHIKAIRNNVLAICEMMKEDESK